MYHFLFENTLRKKIPCLHDYLHSHYDGSALPYWKQMQWHYIVFQYVLPLFCFANVACKRICRRPMVELTWLVEIELIIELEIKEHNKTCDTYTLLRLPLTQRIHDFEVFILRYGQYVHVLKSLLMFLWIGLYSPFLFVPQFLTRCFLAHLSVFWPISQVMVYTENCVLTYDAHILLRLIFLRIF